MADTTPLPDGFHWANKNQQKVLNTDKRLTTLRAQLARFTYQGRTKDVEVTSRRLRAANLLVAAERCMAIEPRLTEEEVDRIVAVLRGTE